MPSTPAQKIQWKQRLKAACLHILEQRIHTAEQAMNEAQQAANSEGKSSMGDKYETSRAMGQLDRDMNARQLEEARRDLAFIHSLPLDTLHPSVTTGSVVICNASTPLSMTFFISLGLGTTVMDGHNVILLSPHAPVAALMHGKKPGDTFAFNGKTVAIVDVF